MSLKPFPKQQILDSPKMKAFVDNNFELVKNSGKFSRRVENTVGRGETEISPLPTQFSKDFTEDM